MVTFGKMRSIPRDFCRFDDARVTFFTGSENNKKEKKFS